MFSRHALTRLKEPRQLGVTGKDVISACHLAKEILVKNVPSNFELKGFISEEGYTFDMVVVDYVTQKGETCLLIITVIGQRFRRKHKTNYEGFILPNMPYKQRKRAIKKLRRKRGVQYASEKYVQNPKYRRPKNTGHAKDSGRCEYHGPKDHCI